MTEQSPSSMGDAVVSRVCFICVLLSMGTVVPWKIVLLFRSRVLLSSSHIT